MVFVFVLLYNTIGKGYLMKVEAPWVKMALYCDDIYIIPGQVDAIPCQAINISCMMFL